MDPVRILEAVPETFARRINFLIRLHMATP